MKKTVFLKPLIITALCAGMLTSAVSAGEFEKETEYRQGVMNILSWNSKAIGAMLKGDTEYDADSIKTHAADIKSTASLNIIAGFPEDSESEDSAALADIWMDFDDFKQKLSDFQLAAGVLDQAAQSADKAKVAAAMKDLGASCKGCHKKYKN